MKILLLSAIVLSAAFVISAADRDQIRIIRNGKVLSEPAHSTTASNVVQLLQSCSVHSTAYAVKTNTWPDLLRSKSFVHVKFKSPQKLSVMMTAGTGVPRSREPKQIQEIAVPLPEGDWPQHIFAKCGGKVLAFTKYDPLAMKHLVFEPQLDLAAVPPYSDLAKLPEK